MGYWQCDSIGGFALERQLPEDLVIGDDPADVLTATLRLALSVANLRPQTLPDTLRAELRGNLKSVLEAVLDQQDVSRISVGGLGCATAYALRGGIDQVKAIYLRDLEREPKRAELVAVFEFVVDGVLWGD